ncbi:LysR family transcriptional regulator [Vibrio sp. 14N.309.X.WAT.E.F5]|uniref:LysR family transcriptional regulator n=1 Tax=Vibrio TaxID=662 RepID=UPI000C81608C|nr:MULTISPECIES: LysR family transcriptional regulator [Vibrio]MDN2669557.1 LysR family transcriptional regulator [Vibrio sp. 14N.309.X.WAT.E.F5]PMJ85063.1 LysR family transcriptional regulator [Vibrio lentus]
MAKDLFSSLDLNLLRTFLIVYQEKNTRKAAERLFVSQPAVSQALQKLRHHFNDDLFVKVHGGLQPTAFSEQLTNQIKPFMDGLSIAINTSNAFDPKEIDYTLKIALSPVVLSCLSGSLFKDIRAQAPNAKLKLVPWSNSSVSDIQKDEVLMGVSYLGGKTSKEVYTRQLIELTGRIFVRKDHPLKQDTITPYDMAGYEIASLVTPGWNDNFSLASQILTDLSIEHSIGFRSELVMALIDVIQHTDMYMPHSNLFPVENYPTLRGIDVSVDGKTLKTPVYSYIHIKNRNSPLTNWLSKLIEQVLSEQVQK